ncbi:MAG: hypothetical protein HYR72_13050 [Deltaproteobacteria bacterium]|nr:hypothetical protein [Deltaproteobacteria bacterium]MBI3390485.1 hypothetical protein [Deltaproteobacteria bacterium]
MMRNAWRVAALLTGLMLTACPPPEMQRERELYAGTETKGVVDPLGRLEVFTTSLLTDGRNVKVRGKLRNTMAETTHGARLLFRIFSSGESRPLQTIQEDKDIQLESGGTTALRMDVETMYANGNFFFVVEAYAKRVGDHDIPPPPGWKE